MSQSRVAFLAAAATRTWISCSVFFRSSTALLWASSPLLALSSGALAFFAPAFCARS
ncbi:MAG: hypothetical protein QM765_00100 [Myxococcales bacterium]